MNSSPQMAETIIYLVYALVYYQWEMGRVVVEVNYSICDVAR